ncbi:transposase [Tolypothrix tenuis PCC 7101]|uniref:Transposase n=1 Tax=Tolypothrix tenuis PCC 7101 TaxID=231146 RepID=A0A1Z4N422_9CYAN|nr:IS630 family transposase [Aulosira sp. FACHB-113]BAZ00490.1 transposase [Tolypothrix tenuis PCC 7101]BAZ75588.1 transposase [Aulosira laxa NIES-50]
MILTGQDRTEADRIRFEGREGRAVTRAHVLCMRDIGHTYAEVALAFNLTPRTVRNIEYCYEVGGLSQALYDEVRPGQPVTIEASLRGFIVATVCSDPPEGFDRWTLRLVQEQVSTVYEGRVISTESIRLILVEHDLKPWQQESWCVPTVTTTYLERMEDVLEVYERPYAKERPVVCLDEKLIQLTEQVRPEQGIKPGTPERVDYEYKRNGTANVFMAIEPRRGSYYTKVTTQRKRTDFAHMLQDIAHLYRTASSIVLVLDNLNTHTERSVIEAFGNDEGKKLWERFEVHYTPVHGSWLNQAEIGLSIYARQCLGRSRIPTIEDLANRTNRWTTLMNERNVAIAWSFDRKRARETFKYCANTVSKCEKINLSDH